MTLSSTSEITVICNWVTFGPIALIQYTEVWIPGARYTYYRTVFLTWDTERVKSFPQVPLLILFGSNHHFRTSVLIFRAINIWILRCISKRYQFVRYYSTHGPLGERPGQNMRCHRRTVSLLVRQVKYLFYNGVVIYSLLKIKIKKSNT